MKKLLLLPLAALVLSVVPATPASSTEIIPIPGLKLKVTICHNGHEITVDGSATAGSQETGHGLLTLVPTGPFSANASFVAKSSNGHKDDTLVRVVVDAPIPIAISGGTGTCEEPEKPEPVEATVKVCLNGNINTFVGKGKTEVLALAKATAEAEAFVKLNGGSILVGDAKCDKPTPPTTQPPKVIEKEVIKEVVVEKKVEVPGPTQVVEITRTVPVPVVVNSPTPNLVPKPAAPAPTSGGELPKTGGSPFLALMGGGVTALGVILRRLFR